jgi:hypothetical protein
MKAPLRCNCVSLSDIHSPREQLTFVSAAERTPRVFEHVCGDCLDSNFLRTVNREL